jgi:hypothetical protein
VEKNDCIFDLLGFSYGSCKKRSNTFVEMCGYREREMASRDLHKMIK